MSDPIQELRDTAQRLSAEGHDDAVIADAMMAIGMGAACRMCGPEVLVVYLHRMIAFYEAGPEHQAPPRMTQ